MVLLSAVLVLITVMPGAAASNAPEVELADGTLRRLVELHTDGANTDIAAGAIADHVGAAVDGDRVIVELHHQAEVDVRRTVGVANGDPLGSVERMTLAEVPIASLVGLERDSNVDHVQIPPPPAVPDGTFVPADLDVLASVVDVKPWHSQGATGAGVKIGIIDYFNEQAWDEAVAAGHLPEPAGMYRCTVHSCAEGPVWSADDHGNAVAEIIHHLAPDAELYLVRGASRGPRMRDAIDFLADQGVTVINRSLGPWLFGSAGNGTGIAADDIGYAASRGILWVNSAGNQGGSEEAGYRGGSHRVVWSESSANGYLVTEAGSAWHSVWCSGTLGLSIRWDDWGDDPPDRTDFDLVLAESAGGAQLGATADRQQSGSPPWEGLLYHCSSPRWLWFQVHQFLPGAESASDRLQIRATKGKLGDWSNAYAASVEYVAADNASHLAVGAMEPITGDSIAHYSSRGPTTDRRPKPDIAAPACITVSIRLSRGCFGGSPPGSAGFAGTSAAAPVVAGLAAVVESSGTVTDASAIRAFLMNHAADMGRDGIDNTFGAGRVVLPEPEPEGPITPPFEDVTPPTWPDGLLEAAVDASGSVRLTWREAHDDVGVDSYTIRVSTGDSPDSVSTQDLPGQVHETIVDGLAEGRRYRAVVNAADAAGNRSTDGPEASFAIPMKFVDLDDSPFVTEIEWLSTSGITRGCNPPDNNRYCPDQPLTRAQMASFLARALHLPAGISDTFDDDDHSPHQTDIDRLAATGITRGCNPPDNNRYCPDQPLTRAQMASFLARALHLPAGISDTFDDDDHSPHQTDIDRLAATGITRGCNPPDNNRYCPERSVTRGEMAAFLFRARALLPDGS